MLNRLRKIFCVDVRFEQADVDNVDDDDDDEDEDDEEK